MDKGRIEDGLAGQLLQHLIRFAEGAFYSVDDVPWTMDDYLFGRVEKR